MNHPSQQGFVILFAVLIAAIVMMIGAGIFSITFEETVLSSTAREAQVAMTAADTGAECALYYQIPQGSDIVDMAVNGTSLDCSGILSAQSFSAISNTEAEFTISLRPSSAAGEPCAVVNIDKQFNTSTPYGPATKTTIISRGFNICEDQPQLSPQFNNPLLVERVFRVSFVDYVQSPD